jgi:glycosyltransferase involved in cell wall biosynthesis
MKIVIAISHSFCANFIRGQAAFLQPKGSEVTIVSADGPEVSKVAADEHARLVIIPFSREISLTRDVAGLFSVIKFLRTEKPDIVNAGNPKTGFLFMLAGIFFPKIPMIFTLRGLRSDTLTGFKKKVVFFTEWVSCTLAKKVIVVSPSLKEHAVKIGVLKEKKAVVLGKGSSNGVNVEKFTNNEVNIIKGRAVRAEYGIKDDDIILGHVGRITKDKGIEELYQAFEISRKTNNNIKLFLTGPVENDDPISATIMARMQTDEDVYFLGNQSDIASIYAAYDVLILYSYREGFGNVALEANSMGKPVIVADIPGARDTVEHMQTGVHAIPRNSTELSKAMEYYIQNPDARKIHGENGAKRARESFSSGVIWQGQLDLYKSLVK